MNDGGSLVAGFWDEATGIGGVAWRFGGETGGVVGRGDGVTPASAAIEDGDELRLSLEGPSLSLEAALSAPDGEFQLSPPNGAASPAGRPAAAICVAGVVIREGGGERRIAGHGHLTRWREDPGRGVLRHLAIPAADGNLIVFAGGGEGPYGDEAAGAWLLAADGGAQPFGESLLSTQYGDDGVQTRAGLELWPSEEGAPPLRAAGDAIGAAAAGEIRVALLRTSTEGAEGVGSYLLRRP